MDDLITLMSSSVQNSEGVGDGGDCADPCQEFKPGFLGVSSFLVFILFLFTFFNLILDAPRTCDYCSLNVR